MAGRPKRVFSEDEIKEIERMAELNCNTNTIAEVLDIPFRSLKRHFAKTLKCCWAKHRVNVRQSQEDQRQTSPQMGIWLGKQDLGQVDKQTITTEQLESKPKTAKDLRAAQAAAKAYNEEMSKEPRIVPITGTGGA